MRWQQGRRSGNVEDRRGVRLGGAGLGLGGLALVAIAWFFGIDPRQVLGLVSATETTGTAVEGARPTDEAGDFASAVLADTEDVWTQLLPKEEGRAYRAPTLVLFRDAVSSACGLADSAVGPFYCPPDQNVYLDLGFFDELSQRYGASGDFAQAYVIAHEVGHHVQHLLGITDQVDAKMRGLGAAQANELSVRLELQADCLAGVWAHHADAMRNVLEPGDIEEALNAAAAIGDDRLQRETQGRVMPDSFTHGTSEQRARWFRRGYEQGTIASSDTFSARDL